MKTIQLQLAISLDEDAARTLVELLGPAIQQAILPAADADKPEVAQRSASPDGVSPKKKSTEEPGDQKMSTVGKAKTTSKRKPQTAARTTVEESPNTPSLPPNSRAKSGTKPARKPIDQHNLQAFFADRLGVDQERLPELSYGQLRKIAGFDINGLLDWAFLNHDFSESALERLDAFYLAELGRTSGDTTGSAPK